MQSDTVLIKVVGADGGGWREAHEGEDQLVGRGGERGDGRAYVASRVGRLVGQ